MFQAGISVYAGLDDYTLEKNLEYLRFAKSVGCEYVFSSAHINEAKKSEEDLNLILNECEKIDLKLSLDISKPMMDKVKLPSNLYALRLDWGFTLEDIVDLSNNASYLVELNASTISKDKINKLIEMGLNTSRVRMSFNFYPKKYTGHDLIDVYNKTKMFKELGFSVSCFIPSHVGFRPPMYEGLPTVENHRYISLDTAVEELKLCGVDGIYFGDAYASEDEIKLLVEHNCDETLLNIELYGDSKVSFDTLYGCRPDYNSLFLRVGSTRTTDIIEPFNTVERTVFSVTVDNKLFKRYAGEINIITKELPCDERVNVIGKVETSMFVLEHLKEGRKFKFKR